MSTYYDAVEFDVADLIRRPKEVPLGLVYFSGIFTPERCGDIWRFDVHPILSNPFKYSSPKILYHDGEFLI
jgi:hypothetical protein